MNIRYRLATVVYRAMMMMPYHIKDGLAVPDYPWLFNKLNWLLCTIEPDSCDG